MNSANTDTKPEMREVPQAPSSSARHLINQMSQGLIDSEALTQAYLDRIDATDDSLAAWAHINPALSLQQAVEADNRRRQGRATGSLHGIPVGIKDNIDTADMPTERGSPIYSNRLPTSAAAVIENLRESGAVILGKTVTTELAWMQQSNTHNGVNPLFSPGGSSSGSAAAVAAGHVPLALGSQTGGSVIRPASYNGIYGYKPSRGLVSRRGVLETSPTLDQMGVFGTDIGDLCLLVDAIKGYDSADPACALTPPPELLNGYLSQVPVNPSLVWIDMPYADRYSEELKAGADELCDVIGQLGGSLERIPAPISFSALPACHNIIYGVEILKCLSNEWANHKELLSEVATQGLKLAESRTNDEYQEAIGIMQAAQEWFETFFHDYDGILTPSAPDIAPAYGDGTGDPICCVIWTLCGLPCLSMPLLTGAQDMPIGIQLIGAHNRDDRLMRTSRWLIDALNQPDT